MDDSIAAKTKIAAWLDGSEGFSLRRERLYDDVHASPRNVEAWLEAAVLIGMEIASSPDAVPEGRPLDEWVKERRARAEEVRDFPENTCPASRHAHMVADALADDGGYSLIDDDPGHVAGSLYGTVAALWAARSRIAELEAGDRPEGEGGKV